MRKLNIAMIGYGFMGRAHSNAWRQVRSFFDVPYEPVLKVICGRNASEVKKVADRFGWEEYSTRWEDVVERADIDVVDVRLHACTDCSSRRGGKEDSVL